MVDCWLPALKSNMLFCTLFCGLFLIISSTGADSVHLVSSINIKAKNGTIGKTYTDSVSSTQEIMYDYSYEQYKNITKKTAVRITVTSTPQHVNIPLMVVIKQENGILSWRVPLLLQYIYPYYKVSRTLCPVDRSQNLSSFSSSPVQKTAFLVDISTMETNLTQFTLKTELIKDFYLSPSTVKNISVSPSQPQYYLYTFPDDVLTVVAKAESNDDICAIFSIQDIQCPVFDLAKNVKYTGMYQTMTYKAAISVQKENYPNGFYVVLVVPSTDHDCFEMQKIRPATGDPRQKIVNVIIKGTISKYEYIKGIMCAVAVFFGFYLVALIIGIIYHGKAKFGCNIYVSNESPNEEEESLGNGVNRSYGSIGPNTAVNSLAADSDKLFENDQIFGDSIETDEIDFLRDADDEPEIVRLKIYVSVKDLCKKPHKRLYKTYRLYFLNLLTIIIFYGLPVLQLVLTYQQVLHQTGDEDICYYNFDCAHQLGLISAFNNVFSNIGYVLLGALFLILVWRRDILYQRAVAEKPELEQEYGIPQYYGLFYAMGAGLCMEGFMSACYHVCPNYSNFQFDTAFMYILACLCMLKIYQIRHPDVNAKAHTSYLTMALIIFVAVIGVLYGAKTTAFWVVLCVVHIIFSLVLTIEIYYLGRWKVDRHIASRLWWTIRTDICKCTRPLYMGRLTLLVLGNAFNWSLAIYSTITKPNDFASYFLAVFIGNLGIYSVFYITMKLLNKEKILPLTLACILFAIITWSAALYFFFAHLTSWQETPSVSREGNKPCILLDFYDAHDIWHFLSAIALFFSFLIYLTLDDDLAMKRRDSISVF